MMCQKPFKNLACGRPMAALQVSSKYSRPAVYAPLFRQPAPCPQTGFKVLKRILWSSLKEPAVLIRLRWRKNFGLSLAAAIREEVLQNEVQ